MGVLRKVSDELYEKGYNEDIIDNYINNKNIQLEMDDNSYTFYFNGNIMFSIELFPQLNDIINNASNNIIQWFESKIKNVQESKKMAKKQLIRLTEGDLHNIIKESVSKILKEYFDDFDDNLLYADPYYGEEQYPSDNAYMSYDNDGYNNPTNDDEIEVVAVEDTEYDNFKIMGINAQKVSDGYQGKIKIYFPNMQQTITDNFRYRSNDLVSNCEFGINYPQDIENQLSEYVSDYLSKSN